jgi:endonuclease III
MVRWRFRAPPQPVTDPVTGPPSRDLPRRDLPRRDSPKTCREPMSSSKPAPAATPADRRHAAKVVRRLAAEYPEAPCALRHENAFQLLVATILSAQCTDERVNQVTPALFAAYPHPHAMAEASQEDLERLIKSTGFFRSKAKNILACARRLVERHDGQVPGQLEQLVQLGGVGRKTANVVLGTAFGIASGVVVDTHVTRITRRLGLSSAPTAEKIEQDLMAQLPKKEWVMFSHRLIHHGRRVCKARKPACDQCVLVKLCPRIGVPSHLVGPPDP